MLSMLALYAPVIGASAILAAALALLGCHLAARDLAMQSLCVGQGAMLGVLLGIGLTQTVLAETQLFAGLPFGLAVITAALTYYGSSALVAAQKVGRNTSFAGMFALLLALTYVLSASFPALESHMSQRFFGDPATMGTTDAWVAVGLASVGLLLLTSFWRDLSRVSFDTAIFGPTPNLAAATRTWWFELLGLLTICFAVQTVGFLFTIACLFIPTATLAASGSLKRHFWLCVSTASLSAALGFTLSLAYTRLPTAGVIVLALGATSMFSRQLMRRS